MTPINPIITLRSAHIAPAHPTREVLSCQIWVDAFSYFETPAVGSNSLHPRWNAIISSELTRGWPLKSLHGWFGCSPAFR
jgi:hypothetical protein